MTRWEFITSDEYITATLECIIVSRRPVKEMRADAAQFMLQLRDELLEQSWISLKDQLPPADEEVEWYDAMFDKVMVFALPDPSQHDGDFSHWKPVPRRPKEWDATREGKPKTTLPGRPWAKCQECGYNQKITYPKSGKMHCINCGSPIDEIYPNEYRSPKTGDSGAIGEELLRLEDDWERKMQAIHKTIIDGIFTRAEALTAYGSTQQDYDKYLKQQDGTL